MFKYVKHGINIEEFNHPVQHLCSITVEEADRLLGICPFVQKEDLLDHLLPENGFCVVEIRNTCVFSVVCEKGRYYLYTGALEFYYELLDSRK